MILLALAAAAQTVFGVTVDAPISLPECSREQPMSGGTSYRPGYAIMQDAICHEEAETSPEGWQSSTVLFPFKALPAIVKNSRMEVMLIDGKAAGFRFATDGIASQELVLESLTEKYGKPGILKREAVQNRAGGNFTSVTAIWAKPTLTVTFLATLDRLDYGQVTIDTPAATKARTAYLAKMKAAEIPL